MKQIVGYDQIFDDVNDELLSATDKHGPILSRHEGYAVILEELDELFDEIRLIKHDGEVSSNLRKEAIQVAAMAMRFIHDVCDK